MIDLQRCRRTTFLGQADGDVLPLVLQPCHFRTQVNLDAMFLKALLDHLDQVAGRFPVAVVRSISTTMT